MNTNLHKWINEDLEKSGLTIDDIKIEPVYSEVQIKKYLGFTKLQGTNISEVGGYFIEYPGRDYFRLKLKTPIDKIKYLSAKESVPRLYIKPEIKNIAHEYKPKNKLIFVEGEKKAVKAIKEGFHCIGISGVWNFTYQGKTIEDFNKLNLSNRNCYICFDSDIIENPNVAQAELRLAVNIKNKNGKPLSIRLPHNEDAKCGLDDYLVSEGNESFKKLVQDAQNSFELIVKESNLNRKTIYKELQNLKDEVELERVLKLIAKNENVSIEVVRNAYKKLVKEEQDENNEKKDEYSDDEIKQGLLKLKSETVLDDMVQLLHKTGVVGEEINLKTLILCYTSRLFDKSIHPIVHGASSSGKSYIANQALKFIPQDEIIKTSFLTPKALAHMKDDLDHKILLIQEQEGAKGSDYSLRTAISEGEIKILVTEKNEITGAFETNEKKVSATGLVTVVTTTRDRVHFENETRLIDLYSDETEQQTRKIIQSLANNRINDDPEKEFRYWQAGLTQLKKYQICNPYAPVLAVNFSSDKVRARRDFYKLLALINSHCLLNQFKREVNQDGQLLATIDDFKAVYELAMETLSRSYIELSKNQESVFEIINSKFETGEFSTHELHQHTLHLVSYRTLERYLKFLTKEGLMIHNGEKAKLSRYTLPNESVSSCRKSLFGEANLPQLLEKIDKYLRQNGMSSNVINDVKADIDDIHDNSRQTQMSLKNENNLNDYSELYDKHGTNDITTKESGVVGDPWD